MLVFSLLLLAVSPPSFDYDRARPFDLQEISRREDGGVMVREIRYAGADGEPVTAFLLGPKHEGPMPGVLFVHGLVEPAKSNKTQFFEEAKILAAGGATALLIDAMWSAPQWFERRDPGRDFAASVAQVKNLRRALDLLARQPGVDGARLAYVAHDFGAMYGATLMGVDRRPKVWALSAPTALFAEWYLLGAKKRGAQRQAVRDELAPLDPLRWIASAAPAPVYLQFGKQDPYVPLDRAKELAASAGDPVKVQYYEAGHELNADASRHRVEWLREQLGMNGAQ